MGEQLRPLGPFNALVLKSGHKTERVFANVGELSSFVKESCDAF